MITTIRLTAQDLMDKAEIERSLQGAKLTHHTIYRRGLEELKDNIPTLKLDENNMKID